MRIKRQIWDIDFRLLRDKFEILQVSTDIIFQEINFLRSFAILQRGHDEGSVTIGNKKEGLRSALLDELERKSGLPD